MGGVKRRNGEKIGEEFWKRLWKACNPAAIDKFVIDDFVITTGGVDVVSRTKFKEWAAAFMAKINDLQFEVIETFQNEDGSRVARGVELVTGEIHRFAGKIIEYGGGGLM